MPAPVITSADNPRFRALLKLGQSRRDRRRAGRTLLDGLHLVTAYRDQVGDPEQLVVSQSSRQNPAVAAVLASLARLEPLELADGLFRQVSTVDTPTGLLAVIPLPAPTPPAAESRACVLLEDIQDPGNLGSILRSTAAAGLGAVYLSRHSVDAWSPRVLRAAMGAHFLLDLYEDTAIDAFAAGYPGRIVATHHQASRSIFATDLTGTVALLFGNEGAGLSRAALAAAHTIAAVPMPGRTESLNIAAAAAVCLFERVRQGQAAGP